MLTHRATEIVLLRSLKEFYNKKTNWEMLVNNSYYKIKSKKTPQELNFNYHKRILWIVILIKMQL